MRTACPSACRLWGRAAATLASGRSLPWIDLAWVMPELFREIIDGQAVLDEWLQRFDIENILRHNAVSDAYATAKLLLIAQARAVTLGKDSASIFMDVERARRWVRRGM